MEELSPSDGQKPRPMSEKTMNIIAAQSNIEAFELVELTNKIQCEICHKYTSIAHIYSRCGSVLPSASEEVKKQIINKNIQNIDILMTSAFKIKKEQERGNKYGTSKNAQAHGKTEEAVTSVPKKKKKPQYHP